MGEIIPQSCSSRKELKKQGWGYTHDRRADKYPYPHDCRADKDSYPHDRNVTVDLCSLTELSFAFVHLLV